MQYDLTAKEAASIRRMRMTPDQQRAAVLAGIEKVRQDRAARLAAAQQARQAALAAMTPEKRAAAEKAEADRRAEAARLATEREALRLAAQQKALTTKLAEVGARLADPQIAAALRAVGTKEGLRT